MRFAARRWRSQPEDRYATPLELADDVEHWLADEPVTAYAEPRGAQAAALDAQAPEARDGRGGALAGDSRCGSTVGNGAAERDATAEQSREGCAKRTSSLARNAVDDVLHQGERGEVAEGGPAPAVAKGTAYVGAGVLREVHRSAGGRPERAEGAGRLRIFGRETSTGTLTLRTRRWEENAVKSF